MTEDEILAEFRAADALLEGHFILSSGLHSPRYLQCARVLADPMRASRLASALAASLPRDIRSQIEVVVSPAMGGIIAGHEMGRALGVEALFVERPTGTFELRRGFRLKPGQRVMLMEDVVTTGLSSREAIKAVEEAGGEVIAAGALVDRSNGEADLGVPFFPLIFLWTPPHFWALSLFVRGDYANAGVPMLPVVSGPKVTRQQIAFYSLPMAAAAVAPWPLGLTGAVYGLAAAGLSLAFIVLSLRVLANKATEPSGMKPEKRLFAFSVIYLFAIFGALVLDRWLLA